MFFFLVSSLSFLLLGNPLLANLLPSWVGELRLLVVLLCQESFCHSFRWAKNYRLLVAQISNYPYAMFADEHASRTENAVVEEEEEAADATTVLDLPELALDCILAKLPPAGLCSMAGVCTSARDRCGSDHLWERHMRERWGRVMAARAAKEGWQSYLASSRKESGSGNGLAGSAVASPRWFCPCSWFKSGRRAAGRPARLPADSAMACYLALESGRFWFPAQVYNRENGHVGFMLSCYDAELRYDSITDTFHARYPPHGQRLANVEEGIEWERLRAPPVDTPAHDLHVSDCLNDLRPGDHIEIQWRRNKGFPYGWWYGVVGHLELCSGNENHCRCSSEDTVMLEFNQYTPDSVWRQTTVSRKDHREEGNETDGFYGGIRKLRDKDEISMWRRLWPTEVLE
ncbi:F-box protein-like isoform X2 [Iris pallida]|uniref:F-box protein-like isoform X2 n=1 Tax=Iris pallida TaxID=29817 RepID=A0AAX6IJC7_IRIPA|nr:F-box protein-like isoform X2 [Iris pallida]